MSERVWTLMEILNTARDFLEEKEIEGPRRSAEALLGKVMGLTRIELYLQYDRPLNETQVGEFRELLRRRAKHEPLQLILGAVDFCGVRLEVTPGLLVPRPETEELADWLASEITKSLDGGPIRLLDIGSGTGCLAVAIAARAVNVQADAVDVDFEAVRCTLRNAAANGVGERVRAVLTDVFSERFLSVIEPPYDVVVSNPPYITEGEYAELQPEVKHYESRQALVAGDDGLAFYRRIADLLPALLKPGGLLAVEIGAGQGESVRSLFRAVLESTSIRNDLAGLPRIVTGKLTVA